MGNNLRTMTHDRACSPRHGRICRHRRGFLRMKATRLAWRTFLNNPGEMHVLLVITRVVHIVSWHHEALSFGGHGLEPLPLSPILLDEHWGNVGSTTL